jgi:hypothetical protein
MSAGKIIIGLLMFLVIAGTLFYLLYSSLVAKDYGPTFDVDDIIPGMPSQVSEAEIGQHFEGKGFEFWSARAEGSDYFVEVNTDSISEDLLASSIEDAAYVASYLKGKNQNLANVVLDVYYTGYALYRISGPVDELADAYDKGDETFIGSMSIEDLRPLDFKIESDLWAFDYLVEVTSIDEASVSLTLIPYHQSLADMLNDLTAMAFIIIQEAPFVDTIYFMIDYEETSIAITFETQDILAYMNEEMDFEELMSGSGIGAS